MHSGLAACWSTTSRCRFCSGGSHPVARLWWQAMPSVSACDWFLTLIILLCVDATSVRSQKSEIKAYVDARHAFPCLDSSFFWMYGGIIDSRTSTSFPALQFRSSILYAICANFHSFLMGQLAGCGMCHLSFSSKPGWIPTLTPDAPAPASAHDGQKC